jgi:hypothetical protein
MGIISQIPPVANAAMETVMLGPLSAFCLIVMTTNAVRMSAQVYPYRDRTPGVTGYRSEVMAEVMIQESEFVRLAVSRSPISGFFTNNLQVPFVFVGYRELAFF